MVLPTPAIPTFTDGLVVHATDLNALAANLTNLYTYNQASFISQKPCVIAHATSGQAIATNTDSTVAFQSAAVNTDNMWTASVPTQVTIQHAGIYILFGQVRWPLTGAWTNSKLFSSSILVNGTAIGNAIANAAAPMEGSGTGAGSGVTTQCTTIANLAAGATVFLNAWQNDTVSQTLPTNLGGSYLGAIFLTPST